MNSLFTKKTHFWVTGTTCESLMIWWIVSNGIQKMKGG